MTPLRPTEGEVDADRPTTNVAEEGVDVGFDTDVDVEAAFLDLLMSLALVQ